MSGGSMDAPPDQQVPVVDYDHHSAHYAAHWREMLADYRNRCPVAHSPAHGGFWLATRYDDVAAISLDNDTYSSDHDPDGSRNGFHGINIPDAPHRAMPIEMDPPEFTPLRRLLNRFFTPRSVAVLEPRMEQLTGEAIDAVIEGGHADLIADIGAVVPAIITMESVGLPVGDWPKASDLFHKQVYLCPDDAAYQDVIAGFHWLDGLLADTIAARRAEPREDMISALVHEAVGEAPLSDSDVANVVRMVVAGGVDTTTTMFGLGVTHLDGEVELRRAMLADPALLRSVGEEILRFYTPTQALARTVTVDHDLRGQRLCRGDRLMLSYAGANQDAQEFPEPEKFLADRFPNRHVAFGLGRHRCLGSTLARSEWAVMTRQVLQRMGDYRVNWERAQRYPNISIVNGWISVPVTFTAGRRSSGLR